MIKVLIADDEYKICELINNIVSWERYDMKVVGIALDGLDAISFLKNNEVDVIITDYGIAINPKRKDLMECMKETKLPICTIEELRDLAYSIVGEPDPVQFKERVVGIIEGRDGTIMDVVREIKPYEFED